VAESAWLFDVFEHAWDGGEEVEAACFHYLQLYR
jgi:hypothetical protein